MTLEQASYLSQVIGSVAVLASLVFVGMQIRQNTKAQKMVAVDSLAAAIAAINVPAIDSPALGEALAKAMRDWGAAAREQRIIAHYFLFSYFKMAENAWYQHRAGVLDASQWSGWATGARMFYHSPGVRTAWWPRRRQTYSAEFQAFLAASEPPPGEMGTLEDLFGNAPIGGTAIGAGAG